MDACCRLCLRSDEFRRFPLYAVAEVSQEVIANMITSCSDSQVSTEDGLPQQICPDCLITLCLANSFRKMCRRSEAKFRECYDGRSQYPSAELGHSSQQQSHSGHQQSHAQPFAHRSSQSHSQEDASFETTIPTIKEEVEFFDYDCDVSQQQPQEQDQWVIQNPRTIRGDTTPSMSHASYYETHGLADAAGDSMGKGLHVEYSESGIPPMVAIGEAMDPSEGPSSKKFASDSASQSWKKKPPTPERFSKRIRRYESLAQDASNVSLDNSLLEATSSSWISTSLQVADEDLPKGGRQLVVTTNSAQRRCEYCQKKMKKPYKHRNGKCVDPKVRTPGRPRCPYCNAIFSQKSSIPVHLRNSCRVYQQLCENSRMNIADKIHDPSPPGSTSGTSTPSHSQMPPSLKVVPLASLIEQKPVIKKNKSRSRLFSRSVKCPQCRHLFANQQSLKVHLRYRCPEAKRQKIEPSPIGQSTPVQVAAKVERKPVVDSKNAIVKTPVAASSDRENVPTEVQRVKCIYCNQKIENENMRYLHHNGRCVLGRTATEHACPHCPLAFCTKEILLRHQQEQCEQYRKMYGPFDNVPPDADKSAKSTTVAKIKPTPANAVRRTSVAQKVPKLCQHCSKEIRPGENFRHKQKLCLSKDTAKDSPRIQHAVLAPRKASLPSSQPVQHMCGYCHKEFINRDELTQHRGVCKVRKMHKQVKCQFCGTTISNRNNLKKHQQVYCKGIKTDGQSKSPEKEAKKAVSTKASSTDAKKPVQEKSPETKQSQTVFKTSGETNTKQSGVKPKIKKPIERLTSKPLKSTKKVVNKKLSHPTSSSGKDSQSKEVDPLRGIDETVNASPAETLGNKIAIKKKRRTKAKTPCEYCGRMYKTKQEVQNHWRKCHVRRQLINKYECSWCSEKFAQKKYLAYHKRDRCKGKPNDEITLDKIKAQLRELTESSAAEKTLDDLESTNIYRDLPDQSDTEADETRKEEGDTLMNATNDESAKENDDSPEPQATMDDDDDDKSEDDRKDTAIDEDSSKMDIPNDKSSSQLPVHDTARVNVNQEDSKSEQQTIEGQHLKEDQSEFRVGIRADTSEATETVQPDTHDQSAQLAKMDVATEPESKDIEEEQKKTVGEDHPNVINQKVPEDYDMVPQKKEQVEVKQIIPENLTIEKELNVLHEKTNQVMTDALSATSVAMEIDTEKPQEGNSQEHPSVTT
ncbi:uncharacterized protein LOC129750096 [Uranotaenia lowii]|uniref:uncharacterized protein LOC129750096 n=1 Tax=Uranotaenia lowii TaxID=190385 RepID=UPI00247A202C|nr:uncharacterized protein LOC129750096 [Uranotaenia lowii]